METLAVSWQATDPGAFRRKYFLASPSTAIGRIFQGTLAVSGDLLPNYWLEKSAAWSDASPPVAEVAGRFRALRNIFAGRAAQYREVTGPGLVDLVREKSPWQADATLRALETSLRIAEHLSVATGDPSVARALLSAQAELVTSELTRSAGALGIRIIEVPDDQAASPLH
jgi:hypothetical protein